jgi:hypothetical protein
VGKAEDEHNAVAWLRLTDRELIERSASLGLPAELHPEMYEPTGQLATRDQLAELREAADEIAAQHSSGKFVQNWIDENRVEDDYVRPA